MGEMIPVGSVLGWILGIIGLFLNLFFVIYTASDMDDGTFVGKLFVPLGILSIALLVIGSGLVTVYDIMNYMG